MSVTLIVNLLTRGEFSNSIYYNHFLVGLSNSLFFAISCTLNSMVLYTHPSFCLASFNAVDNLLLLSREFLADDKINPFLSIICCHRGEMSLYLHKVSKKKATLRLHTDFKGDSRQQAKKAFISVSDMSGENK